MAEGLTETSERHFRFTSVPPPHGFHYLHNSVSAGSPGLDSPWKPQAHCTARWLNSQHQRGQLNDSSLTQREVSSGVPQGTVLDRVLFTIIRPWTGGKEMIIRSADDTKLVGDS